MLHLQDFSVNSFIFCEAVGSNGKKFEKSSLEGAAVDG